MHNLRTLEAIGVKYIAFWPFTDVLSPVFAQTPAPRTSALTAGAVAGYVTLSAGNSMRGDITPLPGATAPIYAFSLQLGTFRGSANGPLRVSLCTASQCATAQSDLSAATDNAPLSLRFNPPLPVRPGATLTYIISHPAGNDVALWLAHSGAQRFHAPGVAAGLAPVISLQQSPPTDLPVLVLQGPITRLYALPYSAPYAQASQDACNLTIISRLTMRSDCPVPATLVRRELFYPGWQATINHMPAAVRQSEHIFQSINLPAGPAEIRFSYRPPYTRLSCLLALAALMLWASCLLHERPRKVY